MKSRKLLSLALAVGASTVMGCHGASGDVTPPVEDRGSYQQPGGSLFFFEQGMPAGIKVSSNSKVELTDLYRKDGQHSLAWDLEPGSTLTFNHPVGYRSFVANTEDQSQSTFLTWIYNSKPQQQSIRFVFGTDGSEQSWFDISLDFDGWRQLIIPFKDMQGHAAAGMDFMQIRASDTITKTTLYFDQTMLSIPVDPRWPTRDAVVPFVNLAADTAPNQHWLALYRYYNFLKNANVKDQSVALDRVGVKRITARLDNFVNKDHGRFKSKLTDIAGIREKFKHYELVEKGGVITGKPLDNRNRLSIFLDKGINKGLLDERGFKTVFDVMKLRDYSEFMYNIAKVMHGDITAAERQELEQMYVMLTRYALDQGYESGSALGTSHHMGYTLRALFQAHYYNRDLLAENGLADDVSNMMAWFAGTGRIYRPQTEMTKFNVDVMNTQLRGMLYSILLQPDESTKAAWLAQFSFWLSYSINNSHGLGGGFKSDGAIFHHAQHYPAYGKGALLGITPVVEALSRTSYAIDPAAHQILKKSVLMTEIYSNNALTLMSVAGRHPDGKQKIALKPFMHMARAGSPDGLAVIDEDMAKAYLRQISKQDEFARYLTQQGFEATPIAEGNWAMNFANLGIQRREGWVAAVRGFSRYLVGNETYANANRYGRYINYGQLEIMNSDGRGRAFSHDGWNWNRWPGTTAVQLPIEQLNAKLRNVDAFSGLEEMLMSEQTYSGALSNGDNGMFAMKLQGHPKYDASFAANKSVFFFDNRIVALGSGIRSADKAHPVETTLLQHAFRHNRDQLLLNDDVVKAGEQILEKGMKFNVLFDPNRNAYIVPGDMQVKLSVGEQQSLHQKNSKPTSGKFAAAVIEHGTAPENGRYAYSVLIDTESDIAQKFARQLQQPSQAPYLVEQQDNRAHIVWDRATDTRGYAFFEPVKDLSDGVIEAVDAPSMVMTTQTGNHLILSVVNPDLNLYRGKDMSQYDKQGVQKEVSIYSRKWKDNPSIALTTKVVLKGQWKATQTLPAGVNLNVQKDGNTLLQLTANKAEGQQVKLTRI